MLVIDRKVGRLVEVRVKSPVSSEDISAADGRMQAVAAGDTVVICADYTHTTVLPEQQASELIAMFRRHNDAILRSAVLVSERSATAVLQMERVIREANLPSRRAFRDVSALVQWLTETLTPEEKARVAAFLAEPVE